MANTSPSAASAAQHVRPIRVVLAKIGLDGHDRGIQVVARALRDAGMAVVRAVEEEDADVLGISLLSGAHMALMPKLIEQLRQRGLDHVKVILGGIIPEEDIPRLLELGVSRVFTPGASLTDVAQFIRHELRG
jgi:methylmalonyl-CoA mutase C-terminal domain/subunit